MGVFEQEQEAMNTSSLQGLRVLVAGGSRGIGLAIAQGCAAAGARLSICARGQAPLQAAVADLSRHGLAVHALPCDLSDPAQIAAWIEAAAGALGGIDVLINNASGYGDWPCRICAAAPPRASSTSPRSTARCPRHARPPTPPPRRR